MPQCPERYLPVPQLLALLQQRGMEISNQVKAAECMRRIGYYRLSGYAYPMRESHEQINPDGSTTIVVDKHFKQGASLNLVADLYVFDKKLRLLMLDAIERVEVGVKVQIADLLGSRDPLAHLNPSELHGTFTRKNVADISEHDKLVKTLQHHQARSREEFKGEFLREHPGAEFPIWMAIEFWDFGDLSRFFAGMRYQDRTTLALSYGLPKESLLRTWIRATNIVRNTCAHHSRLWNRPLIERPSPPQAGDHPFLEHLVNDAYAQTRLYAVAAALQFLLRNMHPGSGWSQRLKDHLDTFPPSNLLDFGSTGFPNDWKHLPLWN